MLHALGSSGDRIDLAYASPPYNVAKAYEKKRLSFKAYVAWQREVLTECVAHLAPGGSVIWQVGTWIDPTGGVHPLDIPVFGILEDLGLMPRNRIIWAVGHRLHPTHRLSGRHESLVWFQREGNDGSHPFNIDAIRVPQLYPENRHYKGPNRGQLSCHPLGKNPSDVWLDIPQLNASHVERTDHPCQMPLALAVRAILMTTKPGDLGVHPFAGACTTVVAALMHGRRAAGADLSEEYLGMGALRMAQLRDGSLPYRRAAMPIRSQRSTRGRSVA